MRDLLMLNWIEIDRSAPVSLYKQIADQIRRAIVTGRIAPGDRLPSSRALAGDLGLSRITALQAYEQLIAEGFLVTRRGSGTRVSVALSPSGLESLAALSEPDRRPIDASGKSVLTLFASSSEIDNVAFQPGIPAFDAFPHLLWSRTLGRHGARRETGLLDYAHIGGYGPLRDEIARYLRGARGVACDTEQVIVTTSVRAAIAAVCAVLLPGGAPVAVEDPGYAVARRVLARAGQRPVPVPVDREGLCVSRLADIAPACVAAYLTPAHHWPTGVTLSAQRRLELLEWAARTGAWIIEDDYDSEYRFDSPPLGTLCGLGSGRVIYVGTFSKTFAPSVRTAYLVVPHDRVRDFERLTFDAATEPALHVQAALADIMASGEFVRHIERMRKRYARRRTLLTRALGETFGARLDLEIPPGGLQILATLPAHVRSDAFCRRAAAVDIHVRDIAANYVARPVSNTLQIGFAAVPEAQIGPCVDRLARAVDDLF